MTINRFRIAAYILIGFNILGTLLTWTAHLQKPGTGAASAVADGTQFTGPLIFVAVAAIAPSRPSPGSPSGRTAGQLPG